MAKSIFQEIESRFSNVPIARGKNVFLAGEYAQGSGLKVRTARERLQRLIADGIVRKVRTIRNGRLVGAYELVSKKKATSE